MSDATDFPWRLHYSGTVLRLNETAARQVHKAIQLSTEKSATVLVDLDYLMAAEPLNRFVIGPGIPVLLTGPAFHVTDVVDK